MAKVEMVQGFVSVMALLLILVFANGVLGLTGVAADFGIDNNDSFGTESGLSGGVDQMADIETEPNMLTSLAANIEFANQLRSVVNSVTSATSILTTLPLVPAWVGQSMLLLTIAGSATLWYLISGKKI
tara:strand:+ start:2558 stop:2944 length:387 start_codon:yes stop_codon:yes gene_type:complete